MKDLTGIRFGRLLVINRDKNDSSGRCVWVCKCDCGNIVSVKSHYLISGEKKSCGCLQREVNSSVHRKHGKRKERIYRIWQGMKTRCYNKNHKYFQNYGGNGITVCDEWKDFEPFYEWAISHGYSDDLSIDRIDNCKGYFPDNCRWATHVEQTRNRAITKRVKYGGEEIPIGEVAKIEGITYRQAYRKYASA